MMLGFVRNVPRGLRGARVTSSPPPHRFAPLPFAMRDTSSVSNLTPRVVYSHHHMNAPSNRSSVLIRSPPVHQKETRISLKLSLIKVERTACGANRRKRLLPRILQRTHEPSEVCRDASLRRDVKSQHEVVTPRADGRPPHTNSLPQTCRRRQ